MRILLIVALILLALFLIVCYLVKPVKPTNQQMKPFYHRNIAHRGLHTKDKKVPENSIPAFRRAVKSNYGIELDIQFSKDFQVVVFHDDTLDRVCGVSGRVDEFTYDELKQMRLCNTGETIPLFSDILSLVDGQVPLIVELKTGRNNQRLCETAHNMLSAYHGDFCIESFDPTIVYWFRKHAPKILRGQLSAPYHRLIKELDSFKAYGLSRCICNFLSRPNFIAYEKLPKPITVKLAEALGAMRVVWTVRGKDDYKLIESKNDTVIFEHYHPDSKFD